MSTELIVSPAQEIQPATLFTPTPKAAKRVLEFFTAQINNNHTRKAYMNAAERFAEWCDAYGIRQLADVQAIHVAAFVKDRQGKFSPPTVKQHLAALAEFERDLLRERVRSGIAAACNRGVVFGRCPGQRTKASRTGK